MTRDNLTFKDDFYETHSEDKPGINPSSVVAAALSLRPLFMNA